MKALCVLLLVACATGCGYSSKGAGMMAVAPSIIRLMPSSAIAGGPAFTMTVNGNNFANDAVAYWNGAILATTFVSANTVTAAVPAFDIDTAETVQVYVRNPGGTGIYVNQPGQSSNIMNFVVTP